MKKLMLILAMLLSLCVSAGEADETFTLVGSLKTRDYIVEMGMQNSTRVYLVKDHSGQNVSGLMAETDFLANYPELYNSVVNSVADDASLYPKKFN